RFAAGIWLMHFRLVLLFTFAIVSASVAFAAPTAEQRVEIQAIGGELTKAGTLFSEMKFKEAGDLIKAIQPRMEKLADGGDAAVISQLLPLHKRLEKAHALLELEGVTLPELKPVEKKPIEKKPLEKKPAEKTTAKATDKKGN